MKNDVPEAGYRQIPEVWDDRDLQHRHAFGRCPPSSRELSHPSRNVAFHSIRRR